MQAAKTGTDAPKKKKKRRRRRLGIGSVFRILFGFIGCVLCLCIMAASALSVLLAMYVVQVTAGDEEKLDLDSLELAQTSIVYDMYGEEYATFNGDYNRIWRDLEDIPQNLQNAVIAIEDKNFYNEVLGINIKRTIAAALNKFTNEQLLGSQQGASTLEQQLIKNLTDDRDTKIMRKVREIFRAIGVARRYSKQTVLEAYLNTIPLTNQIHGMEVAANEYFDKSVEQLTLAECATLASITKNPMNYNPRTNPENLIQRRNYVLALMRDQGIISESECSAAQAEPLTMAETRTATTEANRTSNNSWFTDALYYDVLEALQQELGMSAAEARDELFSGGLSINATVDPKIQTAVEEILLDPGDQRFAPAWHEEEVTSLVPADTELVYDDNGWPIDGERNWAIFTEGDLPVYTDPEETQFKTTVDDNGNYTFYRWVRSQVAAAVLDYDGNIRAVGGGVGEKQFDLGTNRATIPHQTGSTMKPIGAYCLAIEERLVNYSTPMVDTPYYTPEDKKVLDADKVKAYHLSNDVWDPANLARDDIWKKWPENYNNAGGQGGTMLIYDALRQSYNTVAVWVGAAVGEDRLFDFTHNTLNLEHLIEMGEDGVTSDKGLAPLVLGSQSEGVTVVELAGAYSIFYDGSFTTPHYFTEIYGSDGRLLIDNTKRIITTQAIGPDTATIMNRLLYNVLHDSVGTAYGRAPVMENGMEAVAKTGTTQNGNDFTFAGLTPYYVTAFWWGFDKPASFYDFNIHYGTPIQMAWKDLMEEVQADLEYKAFPMAENVVTAQFDTGSGNIISAGGRTGYYTEDNMYYNYDVSTPTTDVYADPLVTDPAAADPAATG